jgi:hypothetical protein
MKKARALIVLLLLVWTASRLFADGPVGVYAMVQKVVFEPNEQAATKVQVWGVFVWVDGGLKTPGPINIPLKGYLYFKLPSNAAEAAATRKQWDELKNLAGTPQIIAFGGWTYAGPFEDLYIPVPGNQEDVRVRKPNEAPAKPITYPIKTGLVKIASDGSHADLANLLKAFLQR